MSTNRDSLIAPMEVRFVEPDDVEKYGGDWHTYDELAIVTTPAKKLIEWESEVGSSLANVMDGFRQSSVFGDTVAAWLALVMDGKRVPFADFTPLIMLAEWRIKKVEAPKEPAADSDQTTPTVPEPPSEPGPIVILPISPPVESPVS